MITIYGKSGCGYCTKAKDIALQYNLKYEYLDVGITDNMFDLKLKLPDVTSVPQIWWDNRHIGGYRDLVAEIENTTGNYGQGSL